LLLSEEEKAAEAVRSSRRVRKAMQSFGAEEDKEKEKEKDVLRPTGKRVRKAPSRFQGMVTSTVDGEVEEDDDGEKRMYTGSPGKKKVGKEKDKETKLETTKATKATAAKGSRVEKKKEVSVKGTSKKGPEKKKETGVDPERKKGIKEKTSAKDSQVTPDSTTEVKHPSTAKGRSKISKRTPGSKSAPRTATKSGDDQGDETMTMTTSHDAEANKSGRSDRPKRASAKRAAAVTAAAAASSGHRMVPVQPYRFQPFKMQMRASVTAFIDFHAHLCECEVIGLLAGRIRRPRGSNRFEIIVDRAFPVAELEETQVRHQKKRGREGCG
jgi:hypothetical protein